MRVPLVAGAVAAIAAAALAASAPGHPVSGAPHCRLFPKSNPWNQRVDHLPVAKRSAAIVRSIGLNTGLHPDFGSGKYNGGPIGIPYTTVAGDHFTLLTDAGNLDVLGSPAGVRDFDELDRTAAKVELDGITVRVASLDELIRMKQAAARPKDLIEVEVLGALREEIEDLHSQEARNHSTG